MQRNNNKSVTYTEEVLREALRKSDLTFKRFSFEEALDGMRLMFDYIISETKEEEVFAINLPKFGILYKNLHFLRNTFRQNAYSDEKIEKLKKQIMELVYFNDQN